MHLLIVCVYVMHITNASKMLLTPRQGATFVAAAAAISDCRDVYSFRYMCSHLLPT